MQCVGLSGVRGFESRCTSWEVMGILGENM